MTPRVAIVVSHPIQHFCPLYRALTEDGRVSLRVFFGSRSGVDAYFDPAFQAKISWQENLLAGFDHEFLPGARSRNDISRSIRCPQLGERLEAFDPDSVQVYGRFHRLSRDAFWWARRHRKRVVLMEDSENRQKRSRLAMIRKRLMLPFLFRRVDAFLTIGDCNERYFEYYGVPSAKFFRSPYPIDEVALAEASRSRDECRRELRRGLSIPADAVVALMVGKLISRKRPDLAIRAIAEVWKKRSGARPYLVLAGDGPDRRSLEDLSRELACDAVRFAGFVAVDSLPRYYAGADFLVHPAVADPHPLAVGEAVYVGLPAVVSDRIGCVGPSDDLQPGRNGFEVPFGQVSAFAEAIETLVLDRELREKMSRESMKIGKARGLAASVRGFVAAVGG